MMRLTTSVAVFALCVLGATSAHADRCEGVDKIAAKLKQSAAEMCAKHGSEFKACHSDKVKKGAEIGADAVKIWNDIAGNSWARIGPRKIGIGSQDRGTLQSPGKRIWVSSGPAEGPVSVKVKHTAGKAGLKMHVCTVDADGKIEVIGTRVAKPGKSPKPFKVAAKGKYVVVDMQPTGALKKYGYKIQLKGKPLAIAAR